MSAFLAGISIGFMLGCWFWFWHGLAVVTLYEWWREDRRLSL